MYIIGLDEVGRGAWAGPLVFGAVLFPERSILKDKLNDSKLLSKSLREELSEIIKKRYIYGIGEASHEEIDELGLTGASAVACRRALVNIECCDQKIILDGKVNFLKGTRFERIVNTVVNADHIYPAVMAASIIAKVYRDALMKNIAAEYPMYGFSTNVGYGTKEHSAALQANGICPYHRKTYAPIRVHI